MENTPEEAAKKCQAGCGCQCHNKCGSGRMGCCGCGGFLKGLFVGVVLFGLGICLSDHFCNRHMDHCYYGGSSMMQNMQPESKTMDK